MKKNKLWYLNDKNQLYPLLSTESPFHDYEKIKLEAKTITGASTINVNDAYKHYVLTDKPILQHSDVYPLYMTSAHSLTKSTDIIKRMRSFGLHTYKQLPDERLFLLRMVHLKAWVWSRVAGDFNSLNAVGKSFVIERNSSDLITHHDEVLSEIILRQAELVAARALYAVGIDIGSVLLAISGTGTISVRHIYTVDSAVLAEDKRSVRQAMRLWQQNRARSIQPSHAALLIKGDVKIPSNHNKSKPLIMNKSVFQIKLDQHNKVPKYVDEDIVFFERHQELFLYDKVPKLWLGADPELIFVNATSEIVPAVDVLQDDPNGRYGFDSVISEQKLAFPVAEIRPDPQQTPAALFSEIESILLEMGRYGVNQQYEWLAGGMPRGLIALGGHLHYSGVEITSRLLKLLDCCLGLTFSLVEDKQSAQLRRQKYGALGDFRRQEHGGFEYRTIPSWLVSPMMTKAAIAIGYVVVKDRSFLIKNLDIDGRIFDDYIDNHITSIREHVIHMFDILEKAPSYEDVKDWIIPLKYMIKVGKRWNETEDVRIAWKVMENV